MISGLLRRWPKDWTGQFIQGMDLPVLIRTLARGRFRVDPSCLGRLAHLLLAGAGNSLVGLFEEYINGPKYRDLPILNPPLFILGHWRSGTTHLHELLGRDPGFITPRAYQASFAGHFIYSHPWGERYMDVVAPSRRPMDNMAFSAQAAFEEEFALAVLSGVSPYFHALFPRRGDEPYWDPDHRRLPPRARRAWVEALRLFARKLTFAKGDKSIVFKSPAHLGRLPLIREAFPQARFIHIVRHPARVYPSMVNLWRTILDLSHLQAPPPGLAEEMTRLGYLEMFRIFRRDRGLIPTGAICQVRYEDLVARPRETLVKVYASLDLPGFEAAWPRMAAYLESLGGYQTNGFRLDQATRTRLAERWAEVYEDLGYEP